MSVRDGSGSELENVTVTLSATGGGNLIDPASAVTGKKGQAKFQFSSSEAGTKTLTAVADGVTISQQPTIAVAQAATTTRIMSDAPDPSAPGAAITVAFTVTSDAGTPTGDVTVSASAGGTCTAPVTVGHCDLVPGGGGNVMLLAAYAGGGNFAASSDTESHTVSAPNAPPTGEADAFTGKEDQALVVNGRGVLANDSDPDGDAIQALVEAGRPTASSSSPPMAASATCRRPTSRATTVLTIARATARFPRADRRQSHHRAGQRPAELHARSEPERRRQRRPADRRRPGSPESAPDRPTRAGSR